MILWERADFLFSNEQRKTERKWVNGKLIRKKIIRQNTKENTMIEVNNSRYTCKTYIKATVIITIIFFLCLRLEKSIETIERICSKYILVCYTRINSECPIFPKQRRKTANYYWIRFMICNYSNACVVHDVRLKLPFDQSEAYLEARATSNFRHFNLQWTLITRISVFYTAIWFGCCLVLLRAKLDRKLCESNEIWCPFNIEH